MIGHVPVKEIFVVPSNNVGIGSDLCEASLDMLGCNGVKSAADVEKDNKAVGLAINMTLDMVLQGRGSGLSGTVTSETVLLRVQGAESNPLINMPGAEALQCFEEVIGKGHGTVGGGLGIGVLAGLGKENHRTLIPKVCLRYRHNQ